MAEITEQNKAIVPIDLLKLRWQHRWTKKHRHKRIPVYTDVGKTDCLQFYNPGSASRQSPAAAGCLALRFSLGTSLAESTAENIPEHW